MSKRRVNSAEAETTRPTALPNAQSRICNLDSGYPPAADSGMTSVGIPEDQTGNPPAGWDSEGEFPYSDFETGNPPEGWESEGQFRNV